MAGRGCAGLVNLACLLVIRVHDNLVLTGFPIGWKGRQEGLPSLQNFIKGWVSRLEGVHVPWQLFYLVCGPDVPGLSMATYVLAEQE